MDFEQVTTELRNENQKLKNSQKQAKNLANKPKLAINFNTLAKAPISDGEESTSFKDDEDETPKQETISISTQTFETAFINCMTCEDLQSHILDVGQSIVNICETQNLPSATNKQNKIIRNTKLSCSNVAKWSTELQKDLSKISYLVSEKESNCVELRNEKNALKEKVKNSDQKLQTFTEEKSRLSSIEKDLNERCTLLQNRLDKAEEELNNTKIQLKDDNERLSLANTNNLDLEKSLIDANGEIEKYKCSIKALGKSGNFFSVKLLVNCKYCKSSNKRLGR